MTAVHLLVALPCEAKPIAKQYRLKRLMAEPAFSIYSRDNLSLTVSGIGKNAMAAATAYTHLLFAKQPNSIWLNIGVAGHKQVAIGTPFMATKISDADNGQNHYPTFVTSPPCECSSLITFSTPQSSYPEERLCDMEASAFFEIASRFSSSELIQCFKIVSDNDENGADKVNPKQVSSLIKQQLPLINRIIQNLTEVADCLPNNSDEIPPLFTERWHFTSSEKRQLKALLRCWKLRAPEEPIETVALPDTGNRKELLLWLKRKTDALDLVLKKKER